MRISSVPEKTANPQAQLPSELEERVRKMTTAAFDAFVEVDSAGRVVNWNAHAKRIFGWSRTEMLGRRICETVVPERFLKEYQQVFRSFLDDPEGPKGNRFEQMTALHKDGDEIIVEFAPSRMQCADGYHILTYVRDITERKRHEKARQDNQEGYQTVIDLIADPYFESDLPGNYTFVNDAFCQMYGTSKDALIGARSSDFLTPENTKMLYDLYSNVLTTGKPGRLEYERKEKGRPSRFVEQSVGIKKDRDGRPVGWVCIVRDVTARKMSEQELARAKEAAEAANISKSTFLATMSHEIRTPMNGVLGMTELVLDSELTAEQREHLGLVKLSAESLLSIINDVLYFSKIEAGKLDFESISFDLRESLGETMKALSFRAHEKGLELVYDVHPEVSEGVIGDPTRVRQIMINLVGNAIKFTERGEVLVTVEHDRTDFLYHGE
jgi:two-component system sensor histidine kinase/response regulator